MIQIPYEQIIEKIQEKSGLERIAVESKVKEKMDMLAGLISKEGAAHIIANEYGVQLLAPPKGAMKIKTFLAGMRDVEVNARVLDVYELREFERKSGGAGKVQSILLADETGRTRAVFWGDKTDDISTLKQNDVIKIRSGYVKENQGKIEIHANDRTSIIVNPPGETVQEVPAQQGFVRKQIGALGENDSSVELFAPIVQCYPPTFFEVCPQCSRRTKPKDGIFTCDTHGSITPAFSCVMNTILDDGTGNIRCVFFRRQVEHLLAKPWEEIITLKENQERYRDVELDLLGRMLKVGGRASKNELFDRVEFVVQMVLDRDPDPNKEIEHLKSQGVDVEDVPFPSPSSSSTPMEQKSESTIEVETLDLGEEKIDE